MYFSETDLSACETAKKPLIEPIEPPNDPIDIGGTDYVLYPENGLFCAINESGHTVRAYKPASNKEAAYRWVSETGPTIIGTKHTFEPYTPLEGQ